MIDLRFLSFDDIERNLKPLKKLCVFVFQFGLQSIFFSPFKMSETTENNNVVDSTTVVGDDDADALFIDEKDIADEVVDEEEATVEDAEDEDNDNDNDDDDDNDNEDNVENVEPARNDSSQQFLEHTGIFFHLFNVFLRKNDD